MADDVAALVERLRQIHDYGTEFSGFEKGAADAITALQAEVERLTRERDEARAHLNTIDAFLLSEGYDSWRELDDLSDAGWEKVEKAFVDFFIAWQKSEAGDLVDDLRTAERRVEELREALKECADDLAEWVENHYAATKNYPSERRRYERDMEPVLRARAMCAARSEGATADPLPAPATVSADSHSASAGLSTDSPVSRSAPPDC